MPYRKFFFVLIFFGTVFLLFILLNSSSNKTDSDSDYQDAFYKNYKIFAPQIPDSLDFAGEAVETSRFDIHESLDRELLVNTYWQSQTMMMFKKANRYFPMIESVLKKNNVPDDFKYLALAESGLSNELVSPAGAAGFWQFMKETAVQYGLEVNENIDERYNIEKSTAAACKYFLDMYKVYKNWTMVAASYNVGVSALNKQVELQKSNTYYDLYLNNETSRYVFRVLAFKIIFSSPRSYGYYFRKKDLYPTVPFTSVPVDSSIKNMVGFAKKYETTYKMIRDLNAWIRKPYLENPGKKTYYVNVPQKGSIYYDTLLKNIIDVPFIIPDSVRKN
jgi:membrane-bound lytic murein transglycosylase D